MVFLIHSGQQLTAAKFVSGYLCDLFGVAAIFMSVLHLPARIPGWLRYLGKISYGLYVYHGPLMWWIFESQGRRSPASLAHKHPFAATLLVLIGTIGIASLSYEFFEKPILRMKRRFETERTRI